MTKINQPKLIFILLFVGLSINSIFNSLAFAFGFQYPFTTFVFMPADLFADFFKVIFSFPHEGSIGIHQGKFHDLLQMYLSSSNPYGGIQSLQSAKPTHFHLPPLSAIFSIISAQLMVFIDPLIYYGLILLLILVSIYYMFRSLNDSRTNLLLLISSFIISYPFLFAVTRGNIYSIIAAIAAINFLILGFNNKKGRSTLRLFFLAFAVNIRPNLIIFIFALLANDTNKIADKRFIFEAGKFLIFSAIIFIISLSFSEILYKDYSFANFIAGLRIYHSNYVIGDAGLAFGSSLFGALKFIFKFQPNFEIASALLSLFLFSFFTFAYFKSRIDRITYIYTLCGVYTLGSTVIADYHLLVFFAPLALIHLDKQSKLNNNLPIIQKLVFISSIVMLVPKNFFFMNGISLQVIFNPLILLCSFFILTYKILK
jgi:hypothetical protein